MKEYKIEGKPVEQYWTEKIAKHLVGRKITKTFLVLWFLYEIKKR